MRLNRFIQHLGDLAYQEAEQQLNLLSGCNVLGLMVRVDATVNIAGGAASGTALTEGVQRLIKNFRVVWDGVEIIQNQVNGRDLYALGKRAVAASTTATNLANANVQTTAVSAAFYVPFARRDLARPGETALPLTRVRQQAAIYVQWETGRTTAASGAGSAAVVSGGDRTVTFTVGPTLRIEQVYALPTWRPKYVPVIAVRTTQQLNAANAAHPLELKGKNPFTSVLFRYLNGANQDVQDGINSVSFVAGGGSTRYIGASRYDMIADILERADYPGVAAADQAGSVMIGFADSGMLGTIPNPARLIDPQFQFDLDAPTSNPSFVRAIFLECMHLRGFSTGPGGIGKQRPANANANANAKRQQN